MLDMILTEISASVGLLPAVKHELPPGVHTLGQSEDCIVRVVDDSVSRHHARLTIGGDGAMLLEDLGSTNGTFIDNVRVSQPTPLMPNQTITLGTADLLVQQRVVEHTPPAAADMDITVQAPRPVVTTAAAGLPAEIGSTARYQIERHIAQGGMGAVMGARQPSIRREVAMKIMLSGADAGSRMRFIEEAQITGQLEHPNIVPVHDLALDEHGQPYYTMKLVKGTNLHDVIESLIAGKADALARYTLPVLLTVFQKVCDALAFAHSHGVIHRDLKPANIMLGDFGEVLVMDWGLAKIRDAEKAAAAVSASPPLPVSASSSPAVSSARAEQAGTFATLDGYIMGTPQFMSPEQVRGETTTLDGRSDIFALGCILYNLLTLQPPFTSKDVSEVLERIQQGRLSKPKALDALNLRHLPGARVPDSLKAVVLKALATEPWQRYQHIAAMQADLTAYQNGFATSAENAGAWKQLTLFVKRHKAASMGVAAVLIIGSTLGTKAVIEGRRAERALVALKASAPSLLALAESEAGFQRFDSALEKLDAALALDPALTAGWWRRVWLLVGMARYAEAPAAFRTAQQRDPAQHAHDALLPVLDAIATAPDDATRFPPERTEALFRHFTKVGASGELNALSQRLTLGAKQKEQMVRKRLDEWLGKGVGTTGVNPDGSIYVGSFPKVIDTLEPLHGLPIGSISLSSTAVKSLEPLRGMALTSLNIATTRISDLSPLRGMAITALTVGNDISDLAPLAGMPLRIFSTDGAKIADISPLRGAPLEEFRALNNRIVDFSPLRGAPLKKVGISANECSDVSFLTDSPALERLECAKNRIADLTPLRGKPLKFLYAESNRITDLRPLADLQLTELNISGNPIADYAPLRELRQLQKLRISFLNQIKVTLEPLRQHPSLQFIAAGDGLFRPVAEFWTDYDAQQAAK